MLATFAIISRENGAMGTSGAGVQSAAGRKAAEAEIGELVERFARDHRMLYDATRRWVIKRIPAAHELVYEYTSWMVTSYSPNENGYDGVLAIRADAKGVRLYLNAGKGVPDPDKLLKGSGTQARYIPLESAAMLKRPEVSRLVDDAIARAPKPFPTSGRGPIVIRAKASKGGKSR